MFGFQAACHCDVVVDGREPIEPLSSIHRTSRSECIVLLLRNTNDSFRSFIKVYEVREYND